MIWGAMASITQSDPRSEHFHDRHELVVCLSNEGSHAVDGRRYSFRSGRTFLLPGGVPHRVLPPDGGTSEIAFVCFDQEALLKHTTPEVTGSTLEVMERELYVSGVDGDLCVENLTFARLLVRELEGIGGLSQGMAGNMLSALLVNHWRSLQLGVEEGVDVVASAIGRICREIVERPGCQVRLDDMAHDAGMSRASFTRRFRRCTGMSLIEYVRSARVKAAMRMLAETSMDIAEVAYECGFANLGYFYRSFRDQTQMTPKQFRIEILERGRPVPLLVESARQMPL